MTTLLELALSRVPLKKVAGTHGGEWHGPCPRCGGNDRFHLWPERKSTGLCTVPGLWGCRACDESGDAIKFLQHMDGLTFKEACLRLGQEIKQNDYHPVRLPKKHEREKMDAVADPALPPALWREKNAQLVESAHQTLLQTPAELAWLAARGINLDAVCRYKLGWLAGERGAGKRKGELLAWYTRPLKSWGLDNEKLQDGVEKRTFKIPRGLVIPRFARPGTPAAGEVVGLRIRRPDYDRDPARGGSLPKLKYMVFKGGAVSPLVIAPDWMGSPAIIHAGAMVAYTIQEAELDAIAAAEAARAAGLPCGAVGMCSNTARPTMALHNILSAAACLLLGLDFDPAGSGGKTSTDKALAKWLAAYPRAKDWPVPKGKDVGEAYALGVNLALWLEAGLPLTLRPGIVPADLPADPPAAPIPTPAQPAACADNGIDCGPTIAIQLAELREMFGACPGAVLTRLKSGGVAVLFDNSLGWGTSPDWVKLEAIQHKVQCSLALRQWMDDHPEKFINVRNFDRGQK